MEKWFIFQRQNKFEEKYLYQILIHVYFFFNRFVDTMALTNKDFKLFWWKHQKNQHSSEITLSYYGLFLHKTVPSELHIF